MGRIAIIAGAGRLPRLVADEAARQGLDPLIVPYPGLAPDWAAGFPQQPFTFDDLAALFPTLTARGCDRVVMAGRVTRPRLDPARASAATRPLLQRLAPALAEGDDRALGAVARLFTEQGFAIVAPHELLGGLLGPEGVIGRIRPSAADRADLDRARGLVRALGALDIGQGAVVAQGLCLALETLPGTEAMLDFVARHAARLRPDPAGARGVLFKGPKPGQDLRMDMPALGPETALQAARAGLGGIGYAAGRTLLIDRADLIAAADREGLFLIGLPPDPEPDPAAPEAA